MRFFIKFVTLAILTAFLCAFAYVYFEGGNLLLNYLAESLHFKLSHPKRCFFAEAFIFKTIRLEAPVFVYTDFPLKIECKSALIELDYSKVLTEGGIGLHCRLEEPVFQGDASILKKADQTVMDMIPTAIFGAVSAPAHLKYTDIFCDLYMYGTTVQFQNFLANSPQVILEASGMADESGKFDLKLKIFFSPDVVAEFGEHANDILEQASGGWMSFSLNCGVGGKGQAFRIETDIFRLNITEYEEK